MSGNYQEILVYIVLPLIGVGLIVFALIWGKRLGRRPIEIAIDKLGIDLKLDALSMIILLGALLACMGVFIWYQGYEDKVAQLNVELGKAQAQIETMDELLEKLEVSIDTALEKFKVYSMRFHLIFPNSERADTRKMKVQSYVWKQGDGKPQISAPEAIPGMNELWVNIDNLNPGDELRLVTFENENVSWESPKLEIPKTDLWMRKVQ